MTGILRLQDDGWRLEDATGDVKDSGGYPLREDAQLIESAAEELDYWKFHQTPYDKVDDRNHS